MPSRVAKCPIEIPNGVEAVINAEGIHVKGAKGKLERKIPNCVLIEREGNVILVKVKNTSAEANMQAGTARSLINGMVHGVSQGFEKKLTLIGVGYRAQAQGKVLNLSLGFSHPVVFNLPEGITIDTPTQTEVIIKGADKQLVGQVAAKIRAIRPPEPYKGKGVRYANEVVILKETKKK